MGGGHRKLLYWGTCSKFRLWCTREEAPASTAYGGRTTDNEPRTSGRRYRCFGPEIFTTTSSACRGGKEMEGRR